MWNSPAAVTTGEVWKTYECVGGHFDGLLVHLWRRARNVILIGRDKKAYEYLDLAVTELSPILAATFIIGSEEGSTPNKLEYSGWLTKRELKMAKELADRS